MPKFRVPMRWDLHTVEEIEAKDPHSAEHWASMNLERPQADPSTWRVEKRIDGVDWMEMEKLYPTPEPPDPMDGWECLSKPDGYNGGCWEKKVDGYVLHVIGDTGPIDVGMGITTYTWNIRGDALPYDITSKNTFHDKVECRDGVLEALENLKKM